ncbi:MAG: dephospho-CoA kinase [Solirubrobacterales bacterium]|nr:dephospho-CoA kinase [Solirubrobacterales bacterium]MBV9536989.1 dephospho-CoA kinase [Solirubrobacterales bacterium]
MPAIPFVGLTGGIGAGKSTALQALELLGAVVLSTDQLVHDMYEDEDVRAAVVERFGAEVAPQGCVDRAALARRAFPRPEDRAWLEQLLWPRVGAAVLVWREQASRLDPAPLAAVVEVPLLFESGMESIFDATIAVVADEELRAARAARRDHSVVDERLARQLSQEEKAARATHVIVNDGSVAKLREELSEVLASISQASGR